MNCIHIKEINNKEPSSLNEEISFFGIEECSLCFDNWVNNNFFQLIK